MLVVEEAVAEVVDGDGTLLRTGAGGRGGLALVGKAEGRLAEARAIPHLPG